MIDVAQTSRSPQNSIHREKDRDSPGRLLSFLVGKEDGVHQQAASSRPFDEHSPVHWRNANSEAQESLPGPME
jgi:hypothetical protein